MDEFKDLDIQNSTNITYYYEPNTSYQITSQILGFLWLLICLVPNTILLYIILKNALQRTNFHHVILHCTIVNLILLVLKAYFFVEPDFYRFLLQNEIVMLLDATLRSVPLIFTALFVYDKYIKSELVCFYSIIITWILFTILSIVEIVCLSIGYYGIYIIFSIIALLKLLSVLSLIIKSIVFCVRGSDEETYKLRSVIAALYIILNCIQWFYTHIVENIFFEELAPIIIARCILIVLFYGIGYINLVLLVRYDLPIKRHFYQLFGNQIRYMNVQFSSKNLHATPAFTGHQSDTVIINN